MLCYQLASTIAMPMYTQMYVREKCTQIQLYKILMGIPRLIVNLAIHMCMSFFIIVLRKCILQILGSKLPLVCK